MTCVYSRASAVELPDENYDQGSPLCTQRALASVCCRLYAPTSLIALALTFQVAPFTVIDPKGAKRPTPSSGEGAITRSYVTA